MARKVNKLKIDYSQQDQHISETAISPLIDNCYAIYGDYVNSSRHVCELLSGIKPVYKRMIETALELPDKLTKTATIAGQCMSTRHPHSSQDAVVNALVRWGIFDGKGSHGMYLPTEYIGPAAPRYTEAKLNPTWRAQISKLMPYVPTFKNDLGYDEAYYIPTPIPLTCAFGGSGIGIGLAPRMVAFDMKSMIDAYRKNDYHLLEANFGLKLLDKESLKSIWETGEGRATYSYHIDKGTSEDGYYGTYIRGSCEAFVPKMGRLNQWKMEGKLLIRDESSAENGNCIFIARGKRISTITDEEIDKEINRVFIKKLPCKLYATFNGVTRPIGLKDWIGICYSNYCSLINKYKDDTVKSIEFQQEVFRHFTDVARTIIDDKEGKLSDQEIATKCKCSKEVVAAIAAKSIRTLQKLEPESKIQKLEKDKQSILAINENKYIDELINSVNV